MTMDIQPFGTVTVGDLTEGYNDDGVGGVQGYGGNLDIRPPYQREFIYQDKRRDDVIHSIRQGFPLNTMYWVDIGGNRFEVLDGQQRTISIARYIRGDFSIKIGNNRFSFHNLQDDQQNEIMNYELMVYVCTGTFSYTHVTLPTIYSL